MTKISVSSRICGLIHTVTGRIEGDRIIIEIDTPCEKFREFTCLEFPLQELPGNQESVTLEMERQINCSFECTRECALDCTRKCLIPGAVFDVCNVEKELTEEKLANTPFIEVTEYTFSEFQ
ncbi:MAG: hypothetical protein QUS12_11995 [Methanosarcina sp.]|jgi:hypothetical protein|uniref:DUF6951 family protein n=1 Tax=Methanosarcina sp. TaxID=2213 RepID=UPI002CB213E5|nr:hypothetical protein [Methanosarcina sp.]MDM7919873.1 hypothetical protein [Methanosarcina sp.]HOW16044.1 hypothetical protein [Methanosarcina sp.]